MKYDQPDDIKAGLLLSEGEEEVCSHFGCGKKLTLHERLYGSKCTTHNGEQNILVERRCYRALLAGSVRDG